MKNELNCLLDTQSKGSCLTEKKQKNPCLQILKVSLTHVFYIMPSSRTIDCNGFRLFNEDKCRYGHGKWKGICYVQFI